MAIWPNGKSNYNLERNVEFSSRIDISTSISFDHVNPLSPEFPSPTLSLNDVTRYNNTLSHTCLCVLTYNLTVFFFFFLNQADEGTFVNWGASACPCVEKIQGSSLLPVLTQRKISLLGRNLHLYQVKIN